MSIILEAAVIASAVGALTSVITTVVSLLKGKIKDERRFKLAQKQLEQLEEISVVERYDELSHDSERLKASQEMIEKLTKEGLIEFSDHDGEIIITYKGGKAHNKQSQSDA